MTTADMICRERVSVDKSALGMRQEAWISIQSSGSIVLSFVINLVYIIFLGNLCPGSHFKRLIAQVYILMSLSLPYTLWIPKLPLFYYNIYKALFSEMGTQSGLQHHFPIFLLF